MVKLAYNEDHVALFVILAYIPNPSMKNPESYVKVVSEAWHVCRSIISRTTTPLYRCERMHCEVSSATAAYFESDVSSRRWADSLSGVRSAPYEWSYLKKRILRHIGPFKDHVSGFQHTPKMYLSLPNCLPIHFNICRVIPYLKSRRSLCLWIAGYVRHSRRTILPQQSLQQIS